MTTEPLAILWGSKTRTIHWMILSKTHGKVCVARASADDGFYVRDYADLRYDVEDLATSAHAVWKRLRAGEDLAQLATHHIGKHGAIEPLE